MSEQKGLVEEIRDTAAGRDNPQWADVVDCLLRAAAEIERLSAELEEAKRLLFAAAPLSDGDLQWMLDVRAWLAKNPPLSAELEKQRNGNVSPTSTSGLSQAEATARQAANLCLYFLVENFPDEAADGYECESPDDCRSECQEGGCVRMRIDACRRVLAPVRERPEQKPEPNQPAAQGAGS